ncbi:MAG: Response regulator [uncultured bacterium]|nr:MAG: Response regulator [uncultured bacterium]
MSQPIILIIDDDDDYQAVLKKCLSKEGYLCFSCYSVEDALKQVADVSPDLVILDLGLNKASGFAFLQNLSFYLKKDQKVPPVLVVSGNSDQEVVNFVTTTLGASCFIQKPVSSSQIISAVGSLLH